MTEIGYVIDPWVWEADGNAKFRRRIEPAIKEWSERHEGERVEQIEINRETFQVFLETTFAARYFQTGVAIFAGIRLVVVNDGPDCRIPEPGEGAVPRMRKAARLAVEYGTRARWAIESGEPKMAGDFARIAFSFAVESLKLTPTCPACGLPIVNPLERCPAGSRQHLQP